MMLTHNFYSLAQPDKRPPQRLRGSYISSNVSAWSVKRLHLFIDLFIALCHRISIHRQIEDIETFGASENAWEVFSELGRREDHQFRINGLLNYCTIISNHFHQEMPQGLYMELCTHFDFRGVISTFSGGQHFFKFFNATGLLKIGKNSTSYVYIVIWRYS